MGIFKLCANFIKGFLVSIVILVLSIIILYLFLDSKSSFNFGKISAIAPPNVSRDNIMPFLEYLVANFLEYVDLPDAGNPTMTMIFFSLFILLYLLLLYIIIFLDNLYGLYTYVYLAL